MKKISRYLKEPVAWWVCGAIVTGGVVWAGFDVEIDKVKQCSVYAKRWQTAHFSEDYNSTCFDYDGIPYVCEETKDWTEYASHVYSVTTTNGEIVAGGDFRIMESANAFYYPEYPPVNREDYSNHEHFDGYSNQESIEFYIQTEKDRFTESTSQHERCLKKLGSATFVKTWYGNQYSIELN